MHIEREALDRALQGVDVGRLGSGGEVEDALARVVDATRALFGVTGAGLMLLDDAAALRYVVATDEPGRVLEVAQEETGEGPCVDSLIENVTVTTRDLAKDPRWPRLEPYVVPKRVHAVLGVPVTVAGSAVGSLNVYVDRDYEWDDSEVDAIRSFAAVIDNVMTTALLLQRSSRVTDQLQHALDHRVEIERAVGIVMATKQLDAVRAFNQLRMTARSAREPVIDVARRVIEDYALR
jgi:GAF domain-containing protein